MARNILENDEALGKGERDRDEVHDFLIDCLKEVMTDEKDDLTAAAHQWPGA